VRKFVPRAERIFALWAALRAAQRAKLSQRQADVSQKMFETQQGPVVALTVLLFAKIARREGLANSRTK
jgi:uncharacterized protein YecT (DUF1311 family)